MAGGVACLLLGWFAFVRQVPVPLLSLVDLGIHELGHLVTYVFPDLLTAMAGSAFQVLVPMGLAAYFWLRGPDLLATGLCLAWAGTSAQQVAAYVADAPFQRLPLIGGQHDWAFILGRLGLLDWAAGLAMAVRVAAVLLVLGGVASCVWGIVRARREGPTVTPSSPAWQA